MAHTPTHLHLPKFVAQQQQQQQPAVTVVEMLEDKKTRKLFIACIILQISQQLSGINAVFYYSTTFFDGAIDNPQLGTTIVALVNVIATYVALLMMDKCGRRTLILYR